MKFWAVRSWWINIKHICRLFYCGNCCVTLSWDQSCPLVVVVQLYICLIRTPGPGPFCATTQGSAGISGISNKLSQRSDPIIFWPSQSFSHNIRLLTRSYLYNWLQSKSVCWWCRASKQVWRMDGLNHCNIIQTRQRKWSCNALWHVMWCIRVTQCHNTCHNSAYITHSPHFIIRPGEM